MKYSTIANQLVRYSQQTASNQTFILSGVVLKNIDDSELKLLSEAEIYVKFRGQFALFNFRPNLFYFETETGAKIFYEDGMPIGVEINDEWKDLFWINSYICNNADFSAKKLMSNFAYTKTWEMGVVYLNEIVCYHWLTGILATSDGKTESWTSRKFIVSHNEILKWMGIGKFPSSLITENKPTTIIDQKQWKIDNNIST